MSRSLDDKTKVKYICRVFLCANKGSWYTARELADFVNNNKLGVKGGISPIGLSELMNSVVRSSDIKRRRKNPKNVWEYGCVS